MSEILDELRAESDEDERLERQWLSEMASAGRWGDIRHYFGGDELRTDEDLEDEEDLGEDEELDDLEDDEDDVEPARSLSPALRERTLALLGATRARDITPGHDELHHYWTRDPRGLAKWAKSPHPWTALYRHLVKFVGSARAKRMAAQWHKEVFGIWVGEKKGQNPLGPG